MNTDVRVTVLTVAQALNQASKENAVVSIGCLYNSYCIVTWSIDGHVDLLALSNAVWHVCMHSASLNVLRLCHNSISLHGHS